MTGCALLLLVNHLIPNLFGDVLIKCQSAKRHIDLKFFICCDWHKNTKLCKNWKGMRLAGICDITR